MGQDDDLLTESFSRRKKCFTIFARMTVVSNIFFALFAVLLIALGGLGLRALRTYDSLYKQSIPAGLLVLGVILLGIIIVGLVGSWLKNTKLLLVYFVLLLFVIICEFGVRGGAYTLRGQIPGQLETSWAQLQNSDKNSIQASYNCCGWFNISDSPGTNCPNISNNIVSPRSLYPQQEYYVRDIVGDTGNYTTPGCQPQVTAYYQSELYIVGTVGILFATLQLVALISSLVVFVFIKIEQYQTKDERF